MSDMRKHHGAHAIQVMTIKVSKCLEFPLVALPGVGHMPARGGEGSGSGVLCGGYAGHAEVGKRDGRHR